MKSHELGHVGAHDKITCTISLVPRLTCVLVSLGTRLVHNGGRFKKQLCRKLPLRTEHESHPERLVKPS